MRPETRYATSGDVSIAYQEVPGGGRMDIVFVYGFVGNLEVETKNPRYEAFFERLGSLGRVIRFDRRGTGLSDRLREVPTLEKAFLQRHLAQGTAINRVAGCEQPGRR
jgi:pimeloyl-ACP methyl ester carboxylesterase